MTTVREEYDSGRPNGIVTRQYNCHECDFQGNRSKALYKHSIESKHKKIDSLAETCYTCKQNFENFNVLMKHRKAAHYDIISECHSYKAGDCKFGDRCYYKHSTDQNNSHKKGTDTDPFHQGEEIPPDLKELTLGFQNLMSMFLSKRGNLRSRQSGH